MSSTLLLPKLKQFAVYICFLLLSASAYSCGSGGGGGGGGNPASPPPQIFLSGVVQAPNGSIAFAPSNNDFFYKLANLILPSANALISGLTSVPDGTKVELDNINDSGGIISTLATTTTSGGTYSFNLTKLNIGFSSNLIVRVFNPQTGIQMRAFSGIGITNINPMTETAVRIVLDMIVASQVTLLSNFTPKEQNDITASIELLSTVKGLTIGQDIETTVTSIKSLVSNDTATMAFVNSASAIGQTAEGPGDIGNYFPVKRGSAWKYNNSNTNNGAVQPAFLSTTSVTGTKMVNGASTFVFLDANYDNTNKTRETYYTKSGKEVTEFGNNDSQDTITSQITPLLIISFPLQTNSTYGQINRTGLDYGKDLDGDGVNEKFDVVVQTSVLGFETLSLPAGTFPNSVRIETNTTLTITLSKTGTKYTSKGTSTNWAAPDVGQIKNTTSVTIDYLGQTTSQIYTMELAGAFVDGKTEGTIPFQLGPSTHYSTGPFPLYDINMVGKVVIGDLNGDGLNDVATILSSRGNYYILIYYQNILGFLNDPISIPIQDPAGVFTINNANLVLGDVNGDGKTDLVVYAITISNIGWPGKLLVYIQDPLSGSLLPPQIYPVSATHYIDNVKIGDINSDGLNDVAGIHDGNIFVLYQNSSGQLDPETIFSIPNKYIRGQLEIADMNNDGHNDIVASSDLLEFAVITQNALTHTLNSTADFYPVKTSYWSSMGAFAVGDLNNDGLIDIVVSDPGNGGLLNVFIQNSQGKLNPANYVQELYPLFDVKIGDINRDGLNDSVKSFV
ncbi:MAG: FG-GAP repeat domain-containing protein [Nitrospiria bacterium]